MFDTFLTVFASPVPQSGRDLVKKMQDTYRQIAQLQARFYQQLLAVAHAVAQRDPVIGYQYAADEIGAALTWTRRRAEGEFNFAWELAELPQVAQALAEGTIDLAKAKVIVYGLTGVGPETAREVANQILVKAGRHTTGQIRARLRQLIIEENPQTAKERYQDGLKERTVWMDGNDDGTANLQPLCDHNHGSKDRGGWRVELIDPHTFGWTSPLGLKYLVEMEPP